MNPNQPTWDKQEALNSYVDYRHRQRSQGFKEIAERVGCCASNASARARRYERVILGYLWNIQRFKLGDWLKALSELRELPRNGKRTMPAIRDARDRFLSSSEVRELFKVSQGTWAKIKKLPSFPTGRQFGGTHANPRTMRWLKSEVLAWVRDLPGVEVGPEPKSLTASRESRLNTSATCEAPINNRPDTTSKRPIVASKLNAPERRRLNQIRHIEQTIRRELDRLQALLSNSLLVDDLGSNSYSAAECAEELLRRRSAQSRQPN